MVSFVLLFISKYSTKRSSLSGRVERGNGTVSSYSSGENPLSIAGLSDKSLMCHLPESALICNRVSVLVSLSKFNRGKNVNSILPSF